MSLSAFPLMGFLQARLRGSRTICSEYETRKAQYAYRCVVLSDSDKGQKSPFSFGLNAPTGAWCSLTRKDATVNVYINVSMHLQVRGAP